MSERSCFIRLYGWAVETHYDDCEAVVIWPGSIESVYHPRMARPTAVLAAPPKP